MVYVTNPLYTSNGQNGTVSLYRTIQNGTTHSTNGPTLNQNYGTITAAASKLIHPKIQLTFPPYVLPHHKDRLWTASVLNRGWSIRAYTIIQAFLFILSNIAVNWYSADGNLNGLIPTPAVITINIIGAISTLTSNTFSKIIEIPNPADALDLDPLFPSFIKFFIANGPERTFYENLLSTLHTCEIFPGNKIIYISKSEHTKFDDDIFEQMITLLRAQFGQDSNYNLLILTKPEQLDIIPPEVKTLIACGLTSPIPNRNDVRIIHFYTNGYFGRIADAFQRLDLINAIGTTVKAFLAFVRWMLTKGIPGAVVIFTITHALSEIENIDRSDSRVVHGIVLALNLMITWIGKMLVNNGLKGNEFDRETLKLIHRITHFCFNKPNWNVFIFTTLVTLITFFPYFGVTSFLYTVTGMETVLKEFNFVANTSIELPHWLKQTITWSAVGTSLGLAWATGSNPIYRTLSQKKKNASLKKTAIEEAIEKHSCIYRIFTATTFGDSVIWANNAWFNFDRSWLILLTMSSSFSKLSDDNPWARYFGNGLVTLGILIYALAWGLYKGREKFPHCMHLWGELRNNTQKGYQQIQNGHDDIRFSLQAGPIRSKC